MNLPAAHVELAVSDTVAAAEWDAFVLNQPDATIYHLWAWRGVFETAFGHRCRYLAARRGHHLVGILPLVLFESRLFGRFIVSLPFVNYGGLLSSDPLADRTLIEHAREWARHERAAHIEFRHRARRSADLRVKQHKVAMLLPLGTDTEATWHRLDRKVRNQVRKAEKSGLRCETGGAERLEDFYDVFARNMRDLGTPVYSRAFFEQILAHLPDRTRVVIVERERKAVAVAIRLAFRDTVEVPWAASLKDSRPLCPNNLLYWSVIEDGIKSGFRTLDFGRSTPGEGTYLFKKQWGAIPEPLSWEYALLAGQQVPDQSPKNPKFRLAIAAWKRLPVPFTRLIGPSIVRSIP